MLAFLLRFKANYLGKTRGYPNFSLWIPIALAKIYFFRVVLPWRRNLCTQQTLSLNSKCFRARARNSHVTPLRNCLLNTNLFVCFPNLALVTNTCIDNLSVKVIFDFILKNLIQERYRCYDTQRSFTILKTRLQCQLLSPLSLKLEYRSCLLTFVLLSQLRLS